MTRVTGTSGCPICALKNGRVHGCVLPRPEPAFTPDPVAPDIQPVKLYGCKHQAYATKPCEHCAEDEKVLEERIDAVVDLILPPISPGENRAFYAAGMERRDGLRAALRSLVREVRR